MTTTRQAVVLLARAYSATARVRLGRWRVRLRAARPVLISVMLVLAGMAGGLGFASLVGAWCVGLVGMAESAGVIALGLFRDDGAHLPRLGARTVGQVLDDERLRP